MSINSLIDSIVRCTRCGAKGMTCGCWVVCECGWHLAKDEPCGSPAHSPQAAAWLRDGYWVIDRETGRPYKTRADLKTICQRIEAGTIFGSRKEANQYLRQAAK